MYGNIKLTAYEDVNEVLNYFLTNIQSITAENFVGMYVIGSLALGDFNPVSSDIDFVIVTDIDIGDTLFKRLKDIHAEFASSSSPWANKIDAVYITLEAFRNDNSPSTQYPQVEHGTELFKNALEDGWIFQTYTLRENGIVVFGTEPCSFINPIDPKEMIPSVKAIAGLWLECAQRDSSWQEWVRIRKWQVFVIQTLCRMLYSLHTGSVASKPLAINWARHELGKPWDSLITRSLSSKDENSNITKRDMDETIDFIRYTVENAKVNW
ncbi:aminoglycoside adenylyltransferase domain-containing protein [Paenibacillus lignilyticus]|uniref:DUF4111 domain-containing protein n=1 Tax=Paenibacillus lignilyticus TaxID=1172615 RepID=A0ABS5CL04_9BACL|nr:aminoglycoside adenylyltransferase domain-containing protein [Paenibacillus lignilyticus]MBP3966537.1 DUF4111 domain-containing protein [Paenibacillus lignilyticus]